MSSEKNAPLQSAITDFGSPMFLGIGVPKGATTWLYELLETHPDVWLAKAREMHFFDRDAYFDRGLKWYRDFFPSLDEWGNYKAVGEITPSYLYCDDSRIEFIVENIPGLDKFICIVRNPINRTFSYYKHFQRLGNLPAGQTFEEFLQNPNYPAVERLYGAHLSRWFKFYDRNQFLILVFEEIFEDIERAKQQICDFLGLDHDKFPRDAGTDKVNEGFTPKYPRIYALAVRSRRFIQELGLYSLIRALKKLRVDKLFVSRKRNAVSAPMDPATRQKLKNDLADDVELLEQILGRKISAWKDFDSKP